MNKVAPGDVLAQRRQCYRIATAKATYELSVIDAFEGRISSPVVFNERPLHRKFKAIILALRPGRSREKRPRLHSILLFQPRSFELSSPLRSHCPRQPARATLRFASSAPLRYATGVRGQAPSRSQRLYEGENLFLRPRPKPQQDRKGAKTMENQRQSADIPKWAALLVEAVNKPGLIMEAYSAFITTASAIKFSHSCNATCADYSQGQSIRFRSGSIRPHCKTWRASVDALHADHAQAT